VAGDGTQTDTSHAADRVVMRPSRPRDFGTRNGPHSLALRAVGL